MAVKPKETAQEEQAAAPNTDETTTVEEETKSQEPELADGMDSSPSNGSPLNEEDAVAEEPSGQELERLEGELAAAQDRLLRSAAEFQNFRRRNLEIRQESIDYGRISTLEQLLDVYDDLTRTVEAIPVDAASNTETALQGLSQGVRLVQEKFTAQLKRMGVEPILTVGTPFDENFHEAVMQQPAPEGTAPGDVIIEVQRGYQMGDRILRHAKVVVAGDPADA